jgi:hypothetical protein
MATTLGIDDKDLSRFIKAKLAYSVKQGKDVGSAAFFAEMLDYWVKNNGRDVY